MPLTTALYSTQTSSKVAPCLKSLRDVVGITSELFTFSLCEKRKPGGDEENRPPDPLRARQVLSQLSYTPIFFEGCALKIEQHPLPESLH